MTIEIKRKEPPKSVEPIEGIVLQNRFHDSDFRIGFRVHAYNNGEIGVVLPKGPDFNRAMITGYNMSFSLPAHEFRELGKALIEMADQIEGK